MAATNSPPAVVLSHSLGGAIALKFVLKYPHRSDTPLPHAPASAVNTIAACFPVPAHKNDLQPLSLSLSPRFSPLFSPTPPPPTRVLALVLVATSAKVGPAASQRWLQAADAAAALGDAAGAAATRAVAQYNLEERLGGEGPLLPTSTHAPTHLPTAARGPRFPLHPHHRLATYRATTEHLDGASRQASQPLPHFLRIPRRPLSSSKSRSL